MADVAGYKEPTSFPGMKRTQSKMVPRHDSTVEMKTTGNRIWDKTQCLDTKHESQQAINFKTIVRG